MIVVLQSIRYLPTKSNRETWRPEKEVRALILQAVEEGKEAASGNALLNMILEAASNSGFSQDETDRQLQEHILSWVRDYCCLCNVDIDVVGLKSRMASQSSCRGGRSLRRSNA